MSRRVTAGERLPGDPDRETVVARMIRVDQAGEYGAARIYEGQLAILKQSQVVGTIREMRAKEQAHLDIFDRMVVERHVRPTLLSPLWHVAGYALGAATALMGVQAAMACTVAVEEVISDHYAGQADTLGDDESELRSVIEQCRTDEQAHRDTGLLHGAEQAPAYSLLSTAIKAGSHVAIWLSTRI